MFHIILLFTTNKLTHSISFGGTAQIQSGADPRSLLEEEHKQVKWVGRIAIRLLKPFTKALSYKV